MKKDEMGKTIHFLNKNKKKILSLKEYKTTLTTIFDSPLTDGKIYKITHQLKNRGYIMSIKKDILYISDPQETTNIEEIEENFYRKILRQHCKKYCNQEWYIGELTALEINLHGTSISIPDEIVVYNKKKQAIETVMFEKKINFKSYESKGKNLYTPLSKYTNKIKIKGGIVNYANLELSILECLYNINIINKGYIEWLILKAIKKNSKQIKIEYIEEFLKIGKHNSSSNRLYQLIKNTHPLLAEKIKNSIKKYGYLL